MRDFNQYDRDFGRGDWDDNPNRWGQRTNTWGGGTPMRGSHYQNQGFNQGYNQGFRDWGGGYDRTYRTSSPRYDRSFREQRMDYDRNYRGSWGNRNTEPFPVRPSHTSHPMTSHGTGYDHGYFGIDYDRDMRGTNRGYGGTGEQWRSRGGTRYDQRNFGDFRNAYLGPWF